VDWVCLLVVGCCRVFSDGSCSDDPNTALRLPDTASRRPRASCATLRSTTVRSLSTYVLVEQNNISEAQALLTPVLSRLRKGNVSH